jgi:predicted cupin superfamily sugar epimerase
MSIVEDIVEKLGLISHPEGGYYSETYRSKAIIPHQDRNLLTSIYFLLTSENSSNFHRIQSDEIWYYHSGSPLIVHTLDDNGHIEHVVGKDVLKDEKPQFTVPAGTIFGSSVQEKESYSLVSCAVAPGFDFRDFELFDEKSLLSLFPEHPEIIGRLTP